MPVRLTDACSALYVEDDADSPRVQRPNRHAHLNFSSRHPAHKLLAKLGWDAFYEKLMAEIESQQWLKLIDDRAENAPYKLCNYKSDRFKAWSEFTILCRGLLIDAKAQRIVAVSFPKFWNFHQLNEEVQKHIIAQLKTEDAEERESEEERKEIEHGVFEKLDGSLGICFYCAYSRKWRVVTRGNFASQQALWANSHLSEKLKTQTKGSQKLTLERGCSYLVEIIYRENKIGVDYGDFEGLALIAGYDENGYEFKYSHLERLADSLQLRVTKSYTAQYHSVEALLAAREEIDANREGFVLCLRNGFRVKFKGVEYLNALKTKKYSSTDRLKQRVKKMVLNDGVLERDHVLKEFEDEFYGEVGAAFDVVFANLLKRTEDCARDLLTTNTWSQKRLTEHKKNGVEKKETKSELEDKPQNGAWKECRSKTQRRKQKQKRRNQNQKRKNVRTDILRNDGKFVLKARKVCGPNVWRSFQGRKPSALFEKAVKRITNELMEEKAWRVFIAK